MTLPKNLQEKRDGLALGRAENFWGERDSLEQEEQNSFDDIVKDYKSGWNDCANLLLPEIKKITQTVENLESLQYIDPNVRGAAYNKAVLDCQNRLNQALQSLREFLGEESGGKNV